MGKKVIGQPNFCQFLKLLRTFLLFAFSKYLEVFKREPLIKKKLCLFLPVLQKEFRILKKYGWEIAFLGFSTLTQKFYGYIFCIVIAGLHFKSKFIKVFSRHCKVKKLVIFFMHFVRLYFTKEHLMGSNLASGPIHKQRLK